MHAIHKKTHCQRKKLLYNTSARHTGYWGFLAILVISAELSHPWYSYTKTPHKKVKHNLWCTFKNYSQLFIVLTGTHRQNFKSIHPHTTKIGAIITSLSRVLFFKICSIFCIIVYYCFLNYNTKNWKKFEKIINTIQLWLFIVVGQMVPGLAMW